MNRFFATIAACWLLLPAGPDATASPASLDQTPNTWIKRTPLADTPPSPRLGYEGSCAWDPVRRVLIRYGGHNQGGGGEQGSEVWTFDPFTATWTLKEPNTAPPGVCCNQQAVFDPVRARFVRFPRFSGSHGWQWFREIHLNDASIWTYDAGANTWRSPRPCPEPHLTGLRCASWDADAGVIVVFGGEGSREGTVVYDPHANEWTRMKPPQEPDFRSGGNMAYDAPRKRHILFGAQFTSDPRTWAYDLRRNAWTDLKPEGSPPTEKNDAVLAYDAHHGVVIALVKISEGKGDSTTHRVETWAYDGAKNAWTKMNPPEEPQAGGNRTRVLAHAPALNLTLLENCVQIRKPRVREQQVWTYRYAEKKADAAPPPPAGLRVATGPDYARLAWEAAPPGADRVRVYRGEGEKPWQAEYRRVAELEASRTDWMDKGLETGAFLHYRLRAVDADGREGPAGPAARTRPPIVEDVVVSALPTGAVEVRWTPRAAEDLVGHHVERAVVEVATDDQLRRLKRKVAPLDPPSVGAVLRVGPFERLTREPAKVPTFTDAVDLRKPVKLTVEPLQEQKVHKDHWDASGRPYPFAVYAYRVRAVNMLGVVSGPSPAVLSIPSTPQHLFSKEEEAACRLKWRANPEKGLRGYRVYRMDGRWEKNPISRLTPDPIDACAFMDPGADGKSRRYYVVAVDAIGQEGYPSTPVWYRREWREYYKPFVGEWHQ